MNRRFLHICSILLAVLLLCASIAPGIQDAAPTASSATPQTESTAKETDMLPS